MTGFELLYQFLHMHNGTTVEELSDIVSVSENTIKNWKKTGYKNKKINPQKRPQKTIT